MTDQAPFKSGDQQKLIFREIPARPVLVHPRLVECVGARAALLICQLAYWQARVPAEQFVYKTEAELREEIGLSENEQRTAISKLVSLGVLEMHRNDVFGRRNFRLDIAALLRFVKDWKSGSSVDEPEDHISTSQSSTPPELKEVPVDNASGYSSVNQSANTEMTAEKTTGMMQKGAAELASNSRALDRVREVLIAKGVLTQRALKENSQC